MPEIWGCCKREEWSLRSFDHRTETAKALGISRPALIYKLQRFRKQGCETDPS